MSTLRELQTKLKLFIAEGDARACTDDIVGLPAVAIDRLGIFRNNSLVTHTSVLAAVFPVVRRLVDPRFFAYLAHEFLRHNPPAHPCLSEYGDAFPGFVASFQPLQRMAYLADVAHLEWAISRVATAPALECMSLNEFASRTRDPALARVRLDSRVRFIASKYPIDLIWQMNQPGGDVDAVDLQVREFHFEVRAGRTELLRRVKKTDWIFRSSIAAGDALGVATEATLRLEQSFDLAGAIARLFSDGLVVSCE
jgi:Putative DNA-binding domain